MTDESGYRSSFAVTDRSSRERKAIRTRRMIELYFSISSGNLENLKSMTALEIGTGSGEMSRIFATWFEKFVTFDYMDFVVDSDTRDALQGVCLRADANRLPFRDESFDVVLFQHVIEHMVMREFPEELYRVLRPGGFCLLASPNRVNPICEVSHQSVFAYYYLPKFVRSWLLKRKGAIEENVSVPVWGDILRTFKRFEITDITWKVLRNWKYVNSGGVKAKALSFVAKFCPKWLLRTVSPTQLAILRRLK
ncbi:MAG: methyltransferase domain-containing protein [Planctomycetes bacterium]|nr:methyltransferase domain-containing protein [Planctomycetota bacterium]